MEPACSEVQEEQETRAGDHADKIEESIISSQKEYADVEQEEGTEEEEEEDAEDEEEEEKEEGADAHDADDNVAEEICINGTIVQAVPDLRTDSSIMLQVSHEEVLHGPDQHSLITSYGDLNEGQSEELNPNPNPANRAPLIYPDDFIDDRRSEMHAEITHQRPDLHAEFADSFAKLLVSSSLELATIPEITAAEEDSLKEEAAALQREHTPPRLSEKENLGGAAVRTVHGGHAATNHDHFSRRSPRLLKNLPPLLPITQQQSMAPPPLKPSKIKEALNRKQQVNESVKPVNHEVMKPAMKAGMMKGGGEQGFCKQVRQPALPVNYRSAIKRRASNDSNEYSLQSPSSRFTQDMNDDIPQNCSRASIESSPCLRQQGCISLDDVRRFSSLHITSRSNSRLERFSLRGGKIDRVARFAQLQKIWKKDSFVRGIDGEKRPQILHHLFAPTRGM